MFCFSNLTPLVSRIYRGWEKRRRHENFIITFRRPLRKFHRRKSFVLSDYARAGLRLTALHSRFVRETTGWNRVLLCYLVVVLLRFTWINNEYATAKMIINNIQQYINSLFNVLDVTEDVISLRSKWLNIYEWCVIFFTLVTRSLTSRSVCTKPEG